MTKVDCTICTVAIGRASFCRSNHYMRAASLIRLAVLLNRRKYGLMIVSKTEPFDKKRSKVFIDGEFCFVLYNSELRKFHIQENEEISSADYAEITEALIPKRCKLRAMNLLQKKKQFDIHLMDCLYVHHSRLLLIKRHHS